MLATIQKWVEGGCVDDVNLIMTFGDGSDSIMRMMLLFTQGAIFLFAVFIIGFFTYKMIALKKARQKQQTGVGLLIF